MANKAISELPQAQNVNNQDLFVLEQGGLAKKLTAETFITEQGIIDALAEALDGHGGIRSVTLSSVSGRIRTYLITFTDGSATTFQVYDGTTIERIAKTSTAGLVDTYTIFMNDGTTTFFTVTNGADGTVSEAMLNDALKNKAPAVTETTESSAIATFTDGADDMVMHNVVAEINPVQSGSGDPSPSNVRTISGWTGCNVTRTGKNLLGMSNVLDNAWINTANTNISTIEGANVFYADVPKNTTVTYTADKGNRCVIVGFKKRPSTIMGSTYDILIRNGAAQLLTATFNTGECEFLAFYFNRDQTNKPTQIQLELGSSATAYEPYQGTTFSVDWTTEAGTVYGGTLDVTTGVLTVTHQIFQVPHNSSWEINNNAGYVSIASLGLTPSTIKNPPTGTENRTIVRTSWCKTNALKASIDGWSTAASSSEPQFVVSYDDYLMLNIGVASPTAAQINQFISDVGLQLYYPLTTPQTYQLTGQQLKTFLGTNNVWADTGNVSVTYPADTKLYIEKLTMPTEDDLVANQAITSGKYFMIGNSLYLALANIANGAQITIGTNAQRVSLADALNTINS